MAGRDLPDTNMMEVITKGSFEHQEVVSRPSTAHSMQSGSQMSLEYLPPEAPYFAIIDAKAEEISESCDGLENTNIEEEEEEEEEAFTDECDQEPDMTETDVLCERVMKLSDDIQHTLESVSCAKATYEDRTREDVLKSLPQNHRATPTASACSSQSSEKNSSQFSDPKTQKAYEKMLKLDEKLASLSQREREVKRQRRLLEEEMEKVGAAQPSSVVVSADHVSGARISPVFHTQPHDTDCARPEGEGVEPVLEDAGTEMESSSSPRESLDSDDRRGRKRKTRDSEEDATNFIKRNIELVSDAGALVMMTKAEKQRLQELLEDETEITDIVDGEEKALCPVNSTTTAFSLDDKDLERMRELDSQLQAILPIGYWDTLSCSSSDQTGQSHHLLGNSSTPSMGGDSTSPGGAEGGDAPPDSHLEEEEEEGEEPVVGSAKVELFQHYLYVSHEERLKAIDEKLQLIHEEAENMQGMNLNLDDEVLHQLLLQCRNEQESLTPDSHDPLISTEK